jgi:hypothetical protein
LNIFEYFKIKRLNQLLITSNLQINQIFYTKIIMVNLTRILNLIIENSNNELKKYAY